MKRHNLLMKSLLAATFALGSVSLPMVSEAAPARRPANQILSELDQCNDRLRRYDFESHINPKYRHQMPGELSADYKKMVELIDELSASQPAQKANWRALRTRCLAVLALFDDADANKTLETESQSKVPADAVAGKIGLLQRDWWANPTTDAQAKVLEQFRGLAKANAMDEALPSALLDVAKAGAADKELAEGARVIIETDLKSQAAMKYKARPDKLGRPLVVTGTTVQGKPFSTADWKGKVVVVDFWATWCGPCREALPEVIAFYEEHKSKGLEIVGVSCDSRKPDLVRFIKENPKMSWPQLFGPSGGNGWHVLAAKYQVRAVPTIYLIDREGNLRKIDTGRFDEKAILAMLNEPVPEAKASPATKPRTAAPATRPAATKR